MRIHHFLHLGFLVKFRASQGALGAFGHLKKIASLRAQGALGAKGPLGPLGPLKKSLRSDETTLKDTCVNLEGYMRDP